MSERSDENDQERPTATEASGVAPGGEQTVLDLRRARRAVGGKQQRLHRLLVILEEDLGRQLGELRAAVESEDQEVSERSAHTIKGHAAQVGSEELRQVAFRAELAARGEEWADVRTLMPELARLCERLCDALGQVNRPA